MDDDTTIRVLLADDEEAIIHVYSVGLEHYFGSSVSKTVTPADLLEAGFGRPDEAARPRAAFSMCRQGEEAVALVKEAVDSGNPFDVVVLDVRMPPGIDGVEAARRIREHDEHVQILFVSGFNDYGRDELLAMVPPRNRVGYVEKPVRLSELAEKILAAAERG